MIPGKNRTPIDSQITYAPSPSSSARLYYAIPMFLLFLVIAVFLRFADLFEEMFIELNLGRLTEALQSRDDFARKTSKRNADLPLERFEGGEMAFYDDRIELCGIKICGDSDSGMMRLVLETLGQKNARGRYKGFSGEDLARRTDGIPGQNRIASAIRDFRSKVEQLFVEEGIEIDRDRDIIQNDRRHGYRLNNQITIRNEGDTENDTANDPVKNVEPVNGLGLDSLNERQEWILERLKNGGKIRKQHVIKQFECSPTTAKRDLAELHKMKVIRYEGPQKTGHWILRK